MGRLSRAGVPTVSSSVPGPAGPAQPGGEQTTPTEPQVRPLLRNRGCPQSTGRTSQLRPQQLLVGDATAPDMLFPGKPQLHFFSTLTLAYHVRRGLHLASGTPADKLVSQMGPQGIPLTSGCRRSL
ncbi:hypothetical protein NDU88_001572 [Pleurodeles waltl]|uniref:Uncharacterized protein n=1 Tax=Pleurodeles waltl TaxID=8319 RepID=A0AAV7R7I5_PLEWA|nr:hypothetical protein NDU88_001572 [Pleurodeles waltl]